MLDLEQGDGIEALQKVPENTLQLVFTDPPWLAGNRKANGYQYEDNLSIEDYRTRYVQRIVSGAAFALKPGGTLAVWVDFRAAPYWGVAMDEHPLLTRCGEIIIESGLGNPGKRHWPQKHSNIILAYKGAEQTFYPEALPTTERLSPPKRVGKKLYADPKRVASVLRHTLCNTDSERVGYPDQKPIVVCSYVIDAFTQENDIVFDCCMGSGTIPIAAHRLGRGAIGRDISEQAVACARKRS